MGGAALTDGPDGMYSTLSSNFQNGVWDVLVQYGARGAGGPRISVTVTLYLSRDEINARFQAGLMYEGLISPALAPHNL